ncbi:MAG: hypothetical protein WB822_04225 [Rhodoplanes sp.]
MPAYQRLGPYNQHCREDRREPAIELDKEQAVAVVEPDATPHSSVQHNQLLPKGGIFGFKSDLGLDECRQQVEGQKDQCDHDPKRDVIPSPVQCGRGFRYTQDAASVAGLLITTEAMVAEVPKKKTPPIPGAGGAGEMGDMDF